MEGFPETDRAGGMTGDKVCKYGRIKVIIGSGDGFQNLLILAELFLVGLITTVARIRSGGLLLPVLLHMEATTLGLLFG